MKITIDKMTEFQSALDELNNVSEEMLNALAGWIDLDGVVDAESREERRDYRDAIENEEGLLVECLIAVLEIVAPKVLVVRKTV